MIVEFTENTGKTRGLSSPLSDGQEGYLSPVSLKQIRVFHVLDGHPVRAWAKDYIR